MKRNTHPEYRPVVFRDRSADFLLKVRSTAIADAVIETDGETLPVIDVEVSSSSHPFYTGKARVMDSEGRVERFNRRYGKADK